MNLLTKQKQAHRLRERACDCWGEDLGMGELGNLGWTCTLLYVKWITNKDLLTGTWDFVQNYVAA